MILVAGFMTLLDVSIVNVALPSIDASLGASEAAVQLIVAGYSLTFGLLLVAAGRAGDIFGRRRLFMSGVAGFVVTSLGCGIAPTAQWLVILRLLQGGFAGILNPQVLGLIQDLFKGNERAKAFGGYGVMVGISTALGPLIGGLLIAFIGPEHGWRAVFLINVPIGLVLVPLAYRWLPRSNGTKTRWSWKLFDPIAMVLLGGAVVTIMWPFLVASEGGIGLASAPLWLIAVGLLILAVLWGWERIWVRQGGVPLIDGRLFRSASYILGVATGFTYFAGFTSIFVVVTLYFQQGLGFTPLQAGLAQMPFAIASGAAAGLSGTLVGRFGRTVPVIGSMTMLISVIGVGIVTAIVPEGQVAWWIIGVLALAGIGSGLVISPNQALTLDKAPAEAAGVAAALLQTMQRMGTSIGLAVVTTTFFMGISSRGYQTGASWAMWVIAALIFATVVLNLVDRFRRQEGKQDASPIA